MRASCRNAWLAHGWRYIIIDARLYDSVSSYDDRDFNKDRANAKLFADEFGRMLPATNRFPSAMGGKGFKPLADQIHAMGLRIRIRWVVQRGAWCKLTVRKFG